MTHTAPHLPPLAHARRLPHRSAQTYDSADGGQDKMDEEICKLAGMSKSGRTAETRRLADLHHGVVPHQHGVLPFHHKVIEPMHGTHNEFNVLLDEAVHQHLLVQSTDPKVKSAVLEKTHEINELWGSMHMQKRLYFGRDGNGTPQPAPAVNGPDMKVILRSPTLLPKTLDIMASLWDLTEVERKKSPVEKSTEAPASKQTGKKKKAKTPLKKPATQAKKAKKPLKSHPARFDEVDDSSDGENEEEAHQPSQTPAHQATCSSCFGAPETTYSQRVAQAFSAFIDFYEYLHRNHAEKASLYPRSTAAGRAKRAERADEAVKLVIAFERAAIALVGEHRRRAYAHDLVYGMHKLYDLFGKPWNGACEGSEHAHQEVKRFFLKLVCHSSAHAAKYSGACHQILKLSTIRQQLCRERATIDLPASEYSASRANTTFNVASKRKLPSSGSGPQKFRKTIRIVGAKDTKYATTAESKMLVVRDNLTSYC